METSPRDGTVTVALAPRVAGGWHGTCGSPYPETAQAGHSKGTAGWGTRGSGKARPWLTLPTPGPVGVAETQRGCPRQGCSQGPPGLAEHLCLSPGAWDLRRARGSPPCHPEGGVGEGEPWRQEGRPGSGLPVHRRLRLGSGQSAWRPAVWAGLAGGAAALVCPLTPSGLPPAPRGERPGQGASQAHPGPRDRQGHSPDGPWGHWLSGA